MTPVIRHRIDIGDTVDGETAKCSCGEWQFRSADRNERVGAAYLHLGEMLMKAGKKE